MSSAWGERRVWPVRARRRGEGDFCGVGEEGEAVSPVQRAWM